MQNLVTKITVGFALSAVAAFAQTRPVFEVATIRPSAPLDVAKIQAAVQAGGKMPIGVNVDNRRAEYIYSDLRTLIARAYSVKPYQITGPAWLSTEHFDIIAKMPDGSAKEDEPKMLQALLEDRFKVTTHRTKEEHPVLALVVGKGGPKLKASADKPVAIDESVPLVPGQMKMDGPDGPIRMTVDAKNGSAVLDMGLKGKMAYRVNAANQSMHLDFSMVTIEGLADMMTQLLTQLGGGAGRRIMDMTDIKGNYEASIEISLADIIAMAKNAGMDMPGGGPGGGAAPAAGTGVAADPNGGAGSVTDAVQSMGLKLENRKAMVDQFIVDHVEKTPTEN